jgi:hypothetical protein
MAVYPRESAIDSFDRYDVAFSSSEYACSSIGEISVAFPVAIVATRGTVGGDRQIALHHPEKRGPLGRSEQMTGNYFRTMMTTLAGLYVTTMLLVAATSTSGLGQGVLA